MIRSDATSYVDRGRAAAPVIVAGALDVSAPVAGHYLMRLRSGAVASGIRIWFGPPLDPVTGEELDRSWRWQAQGDDGQQLDLDEVWPMCGKTPISETDFNARRSRRAWAQKAAPDSSYANSRRKYDPLSMSEPLPF